MRTRFFLSMAAVAALSIAAFGLASAAPVTPDQDLVGGGTSVWQVENDGGTDNGLPAGGSCEGEPGLTVTDANIPAGGDAYDNAAMLWLNDSVFVAPDPVDLTGQTLTAGPVAMSGLDVTMQYYAASATATLRTLITFENPTGATINASADWVNNVGSDGGTVVQGTGSGDLAFDAGDRWIVTSDSDTSPGDPVNTFALFGPGAGVTPSSVSSTVFSCAGLEGILATFDISVPAGGTRHLLFFNQMNAENAEGLAGGASFDTNPAEGGDLLSGLDATQLSEVLNWAFGAPPPVDTPTEPEPTGVPTTEPLSAPPTAVEGPIAAPDTGDGSAGGSEPWIALAGAIALAGIGGVLAVRYARR